MTNTWAYRDPTWIDGYDLNGYSVEATDGSIGKVDSASDDVSSSYIVVDTGPWIFGKKRLIPAGALEAVDHEGKNVHVGMSKEQIKSAPDYDQDTWNDQSRTEHDAYYGSYSNW
jgi:hypothetical protein